MFGKLSACAATLVALALPGAAQAGLLSKAAAANGSASASAVNLGNGAVVLGGASSSSGGGSRWDAATVGGQSLYGKESDRGSTQYVGLLAAAGPTIDALNTQMCRGIGDSGASACAGVLDGYAVDSGKSGLAGGATYAFVTVPSGPDAEEGDHVGAGAVLLASDVNYNYTTGTCAYAMGEPASVIVDGGNANGITRIAPDTSTATATDRSCAVVAPVPAARKAG